VKLVGIDVRQPRDEDELRLTWEMFARAFGWEATDFERFKAGSPIENVLAVFVDSQVVACARVRDFGQFFGGKRIAMGGYSPVAVAADHRGRGYGSLVTSGQYGRLREAGQVLAGLYPATNALYRRIGFEIAGTWVVHKGLTRDLHDIPPARGIDTRRATEDDYGAVEACYARVARTNTGFLDRGRAWWDRLLAADSKYQIYVVDGTDGIDGYVRYRLQWGNEGWATIEVAEFIADRDDVARALWRLIGSSSSIAEHVTFVGPPEPPIMWWLPQQSFDRQREFRWMTRLIDAPRAIEARGFPSATSAAVDLRVIDAQCEWNDGRFHFVLDDGVARLEKGGRGDVEIGIGAFSSLYTGYASARSLASAGMLRGGSEHAHALLDSAFAGPTPWMPDFY
jgi:predicted acetyltransferase